MSGGGDPPAAPPAWPEGAARWLVVAAALTVVVAGLRAAAPVILPLLVAAFLAILSQPLIGALVRRRVPAGLAVSGAILANVAALAALALLIGSSIQEFTVASPRYQARLRELAGTTLEWLQGHGVEVPRQAFLELVNPGAVLELIGGGLVAATAVLSNILVVTLTVVFLLFEAAGLPAKLRLALGPREADLARLGRMTTAVQRYILLKTAVSLATGLLLGGWVWLLGVDFALLWGFVAFALNFVPNLGSIIAAVPPVLLALVQLGPWPALAVALGYLAVNMVLGNVVEPVAMGRRLGLSTLVVFLSLVFWGWVWGPVGMLLSVPLTMIAKILLENSRDLRWVAVLLDSAPGPPPEGPAPR